MNGVTPVPMAQFIDRRCKRLRQSNRLPSTAKALSRWARPVGGEIENRNIVQLFLPIGKLRLENLALQPLPLPDREIRILNAQILKRLGSIVRVRLIKRPHFSRQNPHRPGIGHNVMCRQDEYMICLAKSSTLARSRGAWVRSKGRRVSSAAKRSIVVVSVGLSDL